MQVVQVINSFASATGGAEKLALQFHEAYLKRGIDSYLISLTDAVPDVPNTYALGYNTPYHILAIFRLYALLKRRQWKHIDLIHVHLFPAQIFAPLAARAAGIRARLVTTEHNTFSRRQRVLFGNTFDRLMYHFYRKIVCISTGTQDAMARWLPSTSHKLVTIYNGIDMSMFGMDGKRQCAPSETPIILSAGRLTEQKNYKTAIQAISLLQDYDFEYWIAGQGELEAALKQQVRFLGLEDKVKFLGFRSDLPMLFQQVDIFLLMSSWEGFGLAVAEAMAAGLPVVASDVPGLREVVGEGSNAGFLVDPADPEMVAYSLRALLEDGELRLTMSQNARRQASQFAIEQTIENYVELYRSVLA